MQIPCSEKKLCEKNRQRARKKKTHFRVTLKETTKEVQTFYLVKTKLNVFLFIFISVLCRCENDYSYVVVAIGMFSTFGIFQFLFL